jgi:pyrroloquinoline quinone biosynthesis protein D
MVETDRPRLAKRARFRYDDTRESHVLLLPERVIMLSESAAEILGLCDGARTVDEIKAELRRRYPDAELNDDVDEFLEEARSRRWLESNSTA